MRQKGSSLGYAFGRDGYTLIELIVVIGIIGLLSTIILVAVSSVRQKARDVRRKAELASIGRFLSGSGCYIPDAGTGTYDLATLAAELKIKYPQLASQQIPKDPKSGTDAQTNYIYEVASNTQCIIYANLENDNETINITGISAPTPGKGTGVLNASSEGVNGTTRFYQTGK